MHQLVSIIMPSYNAQAYIDEAISSVLSQTYVHWELIVVDDCSSDESWDKIQKYVNQDSRIHAIRNTTNQGVSHTRNIAIKKSQGCYIAFLDGDDVWLPQKLELQLALMQKENIDLCYSAYHTIDPKGEHLSTFHVPLQLCYADMLKTSYMGTLTTIYNAETLGKIYLTDMGHEDYVMKLEILKHISHARGINTPLAKYRIHGQSLSVNKFKTAQWQWHIYRNIEKLPLWKSCYYFVQYAYNGVMKYR